MDKVTIRIKNSVTRSKMEKLLKISAEATLLNWTIRAFENIIII